MKLLSNLEDLRKLVYSSRVAIVAYLGSDESLNDYVVRVLRKLEEVSKEAISYGSYRVNESTRNVVVVVYIDGREVLEQRYYFMKLELDVIALKMGIRSVMNSLGLRTPF
ncbi:MAG: hypothetical protein RMH84_02760 [Sulfolobales archaeon]|nr:hypothetical protein [Sulfolobales archaeon]MCX8208670.1 hypothetical protein [Sulfolobales archaeon]MDW8010496.1 hypothetical protein [Sulfolobales archaeon]